LPEVVGLKVVCQGQTYELLDAPLPFGVILDFMEALGPDGIRETEPGKLSLTMNASAWARLISSILVSPKLTPNEVRSLPSSVGLRLMEAASRAYAESQLTEVERKN